jgi:2'-5' RNA ligase
LRSFIAIELPESTVNLLVKLQQEFKKCGADVRWIKPGSVHLTLKFLGNINENNVDEIVELLRRVSKKYEAFNLTLSGIGVFPNNRSPRVLWVGIDINDSLTRLQNDIEKEISLFGFEKEKRKFTPHLTLGRFKSSREKGALMDKIDLYHDNRFSSIYVRSVLLMRSDLGQTGAKYY